MKKILVGLLMALTIAVPAHAHAQSGLSGGQGLFIGGALGWIVGRSMPPQQVIVTPTQYRVISIPMYPDMTAPRVYNLGAPPYPGARAVYEERWQFEPTCNCQVKVFNQIGWN